MGKPWEDYKEQIHNLYIVQNLPLKEVQEILKREYQFDACKRAFQNQIEAWGFRKNVRSSEMQIYVQQKKLRKSDSEIDLPDDTKKIITPRKARRFEKRSEKTQSQAEAVVHTPAQAFPQRYPAPSSSNTFYNVNEYADTRRASSYMSPMPKLAGSNMPISLCDPDPGPFTMPGGQTYTASYVTPTIPTTTTASTYSGTMPQEIYNLSDDFYQSTLYELPQGPKKEDAEWFMPVQQGPVYTQTPENLTEELVIACQQASYRGLNLTISKGANVNGVSAQGETPLTSLVKAMRSTLQASTAGYDLMPQLQRLNRMLDILLRSGASAYTPNAMNEYPLNLVHTKDFGLNNYYNEEIQTQCSLFISRLNTLRDPY